MRNLIVPALLAFCFHASTLAQESGLPRLKPPYEAISGKRIAPEFRAISFSEASVAGKPSEDLQQPSFWLGNKRIGPREDRQYSKRESYDRKTSIAVNNKIVLNITFTGSFEGTDSGQPYNLDFSSNSIVYSKPYSLPDGKSSVFKYMLKPKGDGLVELSWDTGAEGVKASPLLVFRGEAGYREEGIAVNGYELALPDINAVMSKDFYKPTPVQSSNVSSIAFAPGTPLNGFTVLLPAETPCVVTEFKVRKTSELQFQLAAKAKGSLIVDFGTSATAEAGLPAPLGGIDFWQHDALDVSRPPCRNLIRNPSFEQGLRYWTWWWGGATYDPAKATPYSASKDALFGGSSLEVKPYGGVVALMSFPVPLDKGKTYTLSYYAKAEKQASVSLLGFGMTSGSKFTWPKTPAGQAFNANAEWKRFSYTFEADCSGFRFSLSASGHTWIDGLQLEEGKEPTEFVSAPVEGNLVTNEESNVLEAGKPFGAKFVLSGKPDSKGEFELSFRDFYRTEALKIKRSYVLDAKGFASAPLPLEAALGNGVYSVKATFRPEGAEAYSDYYRFGSIKSLQNNHPTKTLFGNGISRHFPKSNEIGEMYMRCGWGYNSYCDSKEGEAFNSKYRIESWPAIMTPAPYFMPGGRLYFHKDLAEVKKFMDICYSHETISEEDAKYIENAVFDVVKASPWLKYWTLGCESEGHAITLRKRKFEEYAKLLVAFAKGVKRARPDAELWPDAGTSGWSSERGYTEMEGYLASTKGKVKWDAIAVHPYASLDGACGTGDLDAELAKLIALMAKYGYGSDTHIDIDECFNLCAFNIPEWNTGGDSYFGSSPSYDAGWQEFRSAVYAARTYIINMKYWPQLRSTNIWRFRPFLDQDLTPIEFCYVPNTLGNLFPNPKFKADIRPASGIRGYAFDQGDSTIAAIWCAIDKVDEGFTKGPEIGVSFDGLQPEAIDLMNNKLPFVANKNAATPVRLSPAPLFFKVPKADGDKLVAALAKAEVSGVGSSLKVSILPKLNGEIGALLSNQTGNTLKGLIIVKGKDTPFELAPMASSEKELPFKLSNAPGKIEPWRQSIAIEFANGKQENVKWDMGCFYVPHTRKPLPLDPDAKEWQAIPAIALENSFARNSLPAAKHAGLSGQDSKFQLAWDKDSLYLRVECKDDKFIKPDPSKFSSNRIWSNDGSLEVYFDTIACGRSNPGKGYDQYDYRYDFGPGNVNGDSGPASSWRLVEVFCQLAGGMSMPSKDEAAKNIKSFFKRNGNSFCYVIIFPQWYIEPLRLEKGWRAGFGLTVNDMDEGATPEKGVSNSTRQGVQCYGRPDLWPIMVLSE